MIYPIANWQKLKRGYKFGEKTFYTAHHLGIDIICSSGTPIVAWQDLEVIKFMVGAEGGNTIWVKCPNNPRLFRLMHLLNPVKVGKYKQGVVIAKVGSTGNLSTGPHLHMDICRNGVLDLKNFGNFEDVEAYFKQFVK